MGMVLLVGAGDAIRTGVRVELQRLGRHAAWVRGVGADVVREKPDLIVLAPPESAEDRAQLSRWLEKQAPLAQVPTIVVLSPDQPDFVHSAIQVRTILRTPVSPTEIAHRVQDLAPSESPSAPHTATAASRGKPPPLPPAKTSGKHDDRAFVDASGNVRPVGPVAARRLARRRGEYRVLPTPDELVLMQAEGTEGRELRLAGQVVAAGAMCDVVTMIANAHLGGELVVMDDASARSIFFEPDHVVSAESSVHGERLGEVLYRHGALGREQVEKAAALAHERSVRFGEAVVALGFITREALFALMARQMEEIFYAVVTADHGSFFFFENFAEPRLSYRHRVHASGMLLEAVQRMDQMHYFRDRIPTDAHVPERVTDHVASVSGAATTAVYGAIDGARSVSELSRHLGETEFVVTRALFELVQLGVVVIHPPRETQTHAIVNVFNRAIRMLMRELDAIDQGDAVRLELSRFARHHGLYASLFRNAAPAEDGTLDVARVATNVGRLSAPDGSDRMLAAALYEYASYAMFLARPHLKRAEDASGPRREMKRTRLSGTFRDLLAPIRPDEQDEAPPGTTKPR